MEIEVTVNMAQVNMTQNLGPDHKAMHLFSAYSLHLWLPDIDFYNFQQFKLNWALSIYSLVTLKYL